MSESPTQTSEPWESWLRSWAYCPELPVGVDSGSTVGRYRLTRRLGAGGMATVWEAVHRETGQLVAVKLLHPRRRSDERQRRRFHREARATVAVRHPNVVAVHDLFESEDGSLVLVMDRLVGETLRDLLRRQGHLSLTDVSRFLVPVMAAAEAAHRAGVVHRDLKPENIFLERVAPGAPPRPIVLDFGIAKLMAASNVRWRDETLTETEAVLGTPPYMAPEQLSGASECGPAVDIWAIGVTLYECLCGRRPIAGRRVGELAAALAAAPVPSLAKMAPGLPPRVIQLVDGMLVRSPERRIRDLAGARRLLSDAARASVSTAPGRRPRLPVLGHWRSGFVIAGALGFGLLPGIELSSGGDPGSMTLGPQALVSQPERGQPHGGVHAAAAQRRAGPEQEPGRGSRDHAPQRRDPHHLVVATLAPEQTPWARALTLWSRAVARATEGRVQLDIRYAAAQWVHGGESSVLSRLRTGQLQGAVVNGLTLSKIHPSILAPQLPGIVDEWSKLDRALRAVSKDLEVAFAREGYSLVAFVDVGRVHLLSRGFAVRRPADLGARRVAVLESDPLAPLLYSRLGAAVPVPLGVADILPALQQSSRGAGVTALTAPSLFAEQMRWVPLVDHLTPVPLVCATGGLLLRTAALARLPESDREVVAHWAHRLEADTNRVVRRKDALAYERLKRRLESVALNEGDRAEWRRFFEGATDQFKRGLVPANLVDRVRASTAGRPGSTAARQESMSNSASRSVSSGVRL